MTTTTSPPSFATTRDNYVPHTRRAVLAEAVQLILDGDPELAAWSLAWHTNHLAGLSDSDVDVDEAWANFVACWQRLGGHGAMA